MVRFVVIGVEAVSPQGGVDRRVLTADVEEKQKAKSQKQKSKKAKGKKGKTEKGKKEKGKKRKREKGKRKKEIGTDRHRDRDTGHRLESMSPSVKIDVKQLAPK